MHTDTSASRGAWLLHGQRRLGFVLIAIVALLAAALAGQASRAHADSTITVQPGSMNGWFFLDDDPAPGATALGQLATGPATPPLGSGSAQLTVNDTGREIIATQGYNNTLLSDITALTYQAYVANSDNAAHETNNVFLQFDANFGTGATKYQGRLVFVPNDTVGHTDQGQWAEWDALDPTQGVWYTSHAINSADGNTTAPCWLDGTGGCTWAQVLAYWPDASIGNPDTNNPVGNLLFRAGGPSPVPYTGSVDDFTIGVSGTNTTYDFEPGPATTQTVKLSSPHNWKVEDDNGNGGFTTSWVQGPGTAPLGNGSFQFSLTASNAGALLYDRTDYAGTSLYDITNLTYSTYRSSADTGNLLAPAFDIDVDYDTTDSYHGWQGRLVFEPYLTPGVSGTIDSNTWYSWNALEGYWWMSKPPTVNGAQLASNPCPQSNPCTWSSIVAGFPNAAVTTGLGFKAGSGWANFVGNVDDLKIGVNSTNTTYNFEPETQCTTTCYVNAATGNDLYGGETASDPKATIQAAVNQVSPGGTVYVAAGSYNENVVINKALTLSGSNANIPGNGSRGAEAVITNNAGPILITANDVIIRGFTLTGGGATSGNARGIMADGTTGITILNNVISNNCSGVNFNNSGAEQDQFVGNLFDSNNGGSSCDTGVGIFGNNSPTSNVLIDSNVFTGHTWNNGAAINILAPLSGSNTGIVISNNTSTNDATFVALFGTSAANVTGNNVTGAIGSGIYIGGGNVGTTVFGNTVTGGAATAIKVANAFAIGTNSNIQINRNDVSNNPTGVANVDPGYAGNLNATCNWWGASNGPSGAGSGSGDAVSTNVTYRPWLYSSDLATALCVISPPNGTRVTPYAQWWNNQITLHSSGLTGTTQVLMNGVPTTFSVKNDGILTANVVPAAGTGPITLTVTTPSGTWVLTNAFSASAPPNQNIIITNPPQVSPSPTPSPTETDTNVNLPSSPITLQGRWSLVTWPGPGNISIQDALNAGNLSGQVSAIWTYDSATQTWQAWFPNAPQGANDISTFQPGTAYFIALGNPSGAPITWG